MEFEVKVQKHLIWHHRTLSIKEAGFQIKKKKSRDIQFYPLKNALIVDISKKGEYEIVIKTKTYKIGIKTENQEDKNKIYRKFEQIINRQSTKNAFSIEYKAYNNEILKINEKEQYTDLIKKLNIFQGLMIEMNQKLSDFKTLIQKNFGSSFSPDFMMVHNNLTSIREEMKIQFDDIVSAVYSFNDEIQKIKNNSVNNLINKGEIISPSPSPELTTIDKIDKNINDINDINNLNINSLNNLRLSDDNNENNENDAKSNDNNSISSNDRFDSEDESYNILMSSTKEVDFQDFNYDFPIRKTLLHKLKCPENLVKEMITTFTKKQSSPVYFNEPISMLQKQCEKFYYLDLLSQASKETEKPKKLCYIAAFIIGDIFFNVGRNLKPFSPIIGETYEYYDNKKNFRYFAEQISHSPQISAFCGETPEFLCYGDTKNDTSFKFFKGAIEIEPKNKVHVIFKKNKEHYIYKTPSILIKGIVKNKMYTDYYGSTVIENVDDNSYKCEIKFFEENSNTLGHFEGEVLDEEEEVVYLLKGNWMEEIYITDQDGENKEILLSINKNQDYLKNDNENYTIPEFSCNLNNCDDKLKEKLPLNDSRFRKDIKFLEEGNITEAQKFKAKYEEKQANELDNDEHEIQFFNEEVDFDSQETFYKPNGKYWKLKKLGKLKDNLNNNIFNFS